MHEGKPPSFDDLAVALAQAASLIRSRVDELNFTAASIGLSGMGAFVSVVELERITSLTAVAHHYFRENAAAEVELRAAALRKKNGRWAMFARAAVI